MDGQEASMEEIELKQKKKRGCRISKFFCWVAALLYAEMASKLLTV